MKETTNQNLKKKTHRVSNMKKNLKCKNYNFQAVCLELKKKKYWKQLRDSISASYYWLGWKTKRRNRKKTTANSIRDRLEGC